MRAWHIDWFFRAVAVGRSVVGLPHPHAVARGLGPVAAGCHVTPPASPVLGSVKEHTRAAPVGAPTDPGQFANHQRVGRALDDRNHQPGERVADGNETTCEAAIAFWLEPSRTGTPPQNPVDL